MRIYLLLFVFFLIQLSPAQAFIPVQSTSENTIFQEWKERIIKKKKARKNTKRAKRKQEKLRKKMRKLEAKIAKKEAVRGGNIWGDAKFRVGIILLVAAILAALLSSLFLGGFFGFLGGLLALGGLVLVLWSLIENFA